jgi:hypothetical protein
MTPAPLTSTLDHGSRPPARLGQIPARRALESAGYVLFGLFIFLIGFDLIQPSPYDYLAGPVIFFWLVLGVRLPRSAFLFVALLFLLCLGVFLSLIPHLDRGDSVFWAAISLYLAITAVFFTMFFSEDSARRVELALKAFLASCFVTAAAGIMGYFDVLGTAARFTAMERASGTFEDPNVFGSFLVLGILFVLRDLLTGEGRRPWLGIVMLPVLLAGVLLAFSRGAWVATALGAGALLVMTFATTSSMRVRRRIVLLTLVATLVGTAALVGLLATEEVQRMAEMRAQALQDYDSGVTGRFGNQLRSIPLLAERPNGFGPLRYRAWFASEPHSSYINAFASGGWIGGFAFIGLMLATTYVGLRLSLQPSPYRRHAQILFATHLTFVLQSVQIDLDHWRHVYLVWGALWGLEAARLRWLREQRRAVLGAWPNARAAEAP